MPQFNDINFRANNSSAPDGSGRFELSSTYTMTSANPASVPGPLPILGIPPVLLFSRKLKARIKALREASNPTLL